MARSRNVKPGLYSNEDLAECSIWARYIFPGLWMLADREGRLQDRPKKIKGELLPFDTVEVGPLLDELEHRGFIARYEARGLRVIQVVNFLKHQNPHFREAASTLPTAESLGLAPHSMITEPQAQHVFNEPKASGLPQAGPGLDPPKVDMERGSSRADSLFSDSLIPDSGFLNPDSGSPGAHQSAGAHDSNPNESKNRAKPKGGFNAESITLPDWLDRELWCGWVAERKAKGKPITERSAREQIKTLAEYRDAGHTPERVIGHAIASGYQGLFTPPGIKPAQPQSLKGIDYSLDTAERRAQTTAEGRRLLGFGPLETVDV